MANVPHGLLACLLLCLPAATAQTGLKVQLVPEVKSIKAGEPFYVGLYLQHEPGYHTYWKYPGIVGVPTTMAWDLPAGFEAGPLEYPEPETTTMFQIRAQGYERDLLLQTRITPPANLAPGQQIALSGSASWMCCGRTCHPASMPLKLILPVAAEAVLDSRWHPLFEKERAAFSQPSSAWVATATEDDKSVTVTLRAVSGEARPFAGAPPAVRFFTEDGWINSDEPQTATLDSEGSLVLVLRRSDVFTGPAPPKKLHGIVQRPDGWLTGGQLRSLNIAPDLMR